MWGISSLKYVQSSRLEKRQRPPYDEIRTTATFFWSTVYLGASRTGRRLDGIELGGLKVGEFI